MRLIDADSLMDTLEQMQRNADKCIPVERGIWMGFNYSLTEIKGSPTVDAVPVVMCKDCKYYGAEGGSVKDGRYKRCSICGAWHTGSWYCASGERKDDVSD